MGHSMWCFIVLAFCTSIASTQQIDLNTDSTVLADCISTVDFRKPLDDLSTECKDSFESLLPSQDNIVRFLVQFEDPNVQQQAQQALKETFVAMLNDSGGVLTYGGYSETDSTSRIPDSIPNELRFEILHNMMQQNGDGPFRAPPMLRARLHNYRNLLLRQRNYAAAYWIDRLLKHSGPPSDGTVIGRDRAVVHRV
uniref:Uncharacterized protein n=1 Tax=Anopheles christyi TaxID=43041 RepID=A0A182K7H2_9DIPT